MAPPEWVPAIVQLSEEETNNPAKLLKACSENLSVIRDFLITSKEQVAKKTGCLVVIDLIGKYLNKIQLLDARGGELNEEKLCSVVERIISCKLEEKLGVLKNSSVPTYSNVVARTKTSSPYTKNNTTVTKNEVKHKVIIKPGSTCRNIKSAEDTRKLLMKNSPKDYGIQVDKIAPLKDNMILLESRSKTIYELEKSPLLANVNLKATAVKKNWPKIQIFDVPENTTKEEIISILNKQDLPETVPEDYIKLAFKSRIPGRSNDTQGDSTSWILEIHPAARAHLVQAGKIYGDWRTHNIRDFIQVTRCYNCQRYGHIAKHCTGQKQCGYCAATDHESKACPNIKKTENHKCANCLRSNLKQTDHHTADNSCPIFISRTNDLINQTEYSLDE